jgi:hypothetical protein
MNVTVGIRICPTRIIGKVIEMTEHPRNFSRENVRSKGRLPLSAPHPHPVRPTHCSRSLSLKRRQTTGHQSGR